jgi:KamA family protein
MRRQKMITPRNMKFYGLKDIDNIPQLDVLSKDQKFETKVVANVLPFRTNNYVVEELIDWNNIPDDPIFQLTFMQKDMISGDQFSRMADTLIKYGDDVNKIKEAASEIRMELNPHPSAQMTLNVPKLNEHPVPGIQHKYKETVLIFPSSGQTCHAYCTFCFRWAQFVGMTDLKFATDESQKFQEYIKANKDVTDVLLTGGDPMIMTAKNLAAYIEPLLTSEFDHIQNIRIGTKSVAYWPYKFVTDKDADDVLRLFEKVEKSGKHLAIMGHYNHWVELSTPVAQEAIKRIRNTGAEIRTQSPLVKHVNDNPDVWARMWNDQVRLGCVPYYFFIERNTGAKHYFAIPLVNVYDIFINAYKKVSGLGRTVRGPSMSALPGKIRIDGISEIKGEKIIALTMVQARNPQWVRKPFFAEYSENATWYNELKPAFGEDKFFFQKELDQMIEASHGQMYFDVEDEYTDVIDAFNEY